MDMKRKQSEKFKKNLSIKSKTNRHKTGNRDAYLEWKKNKLKHECLKLLRKERKQTQRESKKVVTMETGDSDAEEEPRKKKTRTDKETKSFDDVSAKAQSHIFSKAQKTFQENKETKEREKEEQDKKMAEQRKAMKKYRNKKKKRQMMVNKKTHKGQPIMKYQMNALLNKIKAQVETS